MSARIGIRLSARTMAGAHIIEATLPTKTRLRVSIGPPDIKVSEITLSVRRVCSLGWAGKDHGRTVIPSDLLTVATRKMRAFVIEATILAEPTADKLTDGEPSGWSGGSRKIGSF
jgi:hypothetical protein